MSNLNGEDLKTTEKRDGCHLCGRTGKNILKLQGKTTCYWCREEKKVRL